MGDDYKAAYLAAYASASAISPLAVVALVIACWVTLFSGGQNAIKACLFMAALIPAAQMVRVAGLHLHFFRVLLLVGLIRLLMRGETRGFQWHIVDKLTIWWGAIEVVCSVLRGIRFEDIAIVFAAWASYFLVRCLCKRPEDFLEHLRLLALLMLIIAVCMGVESVTKYNPFRIFGGVEIIPDMRAGRVRCQGPFRQFILAGCFAATLFPLMVGLWLQGRPHRMRAAIGMGSSILGIYFCNSSGPILSFMVAVGGLAFWPMRFRMRYFRRGCVLFVVVIALVMKAPVWYFIDRVGGLFGGGSWHRCYLIDQFVGHIPQWFLVGTNYTANWAPGGTVLAVDPNNMDITNNYIEQAIRGGIWQFVVFLAIIVSCFKIVGHLVRGSPDRVLAPKMIWVLGITLTGHCVAFIDIAYFDQSSVFLYWLLAVIVCFSTYAADVDGQTPADQDVAAAEPALALSKAI